MNWTGGKRRRHHNHQALQFNWQCNKNWDMIGILTQPVRKPQVMNSSSQMYSSYKEAANLWVDSSSCAASPPPSPIHAFPQNDANLNNPSNEVAAMEALESTNPFILRSEGITQLIATPSQWGEERQSIATDEFQSSIEARISTLERSVEKIFLILKSIKSHPSISLDE